MERIYFGNPSPEAFGPFIRNITQRTGLTLEEIALHTDTKFETLKSWICPVTSKRHRNISQTLYFYIMIRLSQLLENKVEIHFDEKEEAFDAMIFVEFIVLQLQATERISYYISPEKFCKQFNVGPNTEQILCSMNVEQEDFNMFQGMIAIINVTFDSPFAIATLEEKLGKRER